MKLGPKRILLFCGAAVALFFASLASAQSTPDGHWEGTVTMKERQIDVSLDLAKNAKSGWIASMGVPSQNATGLVVNDVAVKDTSVTFVAVELGMARFELKLSDGRMTGTCATPQGPMPVELKRTGEAHVELIPPSPAVSTHLEGDWEGSLQTPRRAFRILVHFKNQPDKTVLATIDTPDSGAIGLPLNDVKQAGQSVEFGVRVAHARFQGTLNEKATELSGQWIHGEQSLPLTLQKK